MWPLSCRLWGFLENFKAVERWGLVFSQVRSLWWHFWSCLISVTRCWADIRLAFVISLADNHEHHGATSKKACETRKPQILLSQILLTRSTCFSGSALPSRCASSSTPLTIKCLTEEGHFVTVDADLTKNQGVGVMTLACFPQFQALHWYPSHTVVPRMWTFLLLCFTPPCQGTGKKKPCFKIYFKYIFFFSSL